MAHATKSLSFGVTASTTYENPYALARKFATLDHISQGRVGWNIVTSYLDSAAKSYGLDEQVPHDERYARADEFMQVVYKLLEGSWQEGAVVKDKKTGIYVKPEAVKRIDHKGYFEHRFYDSRIIFNKSLESITNALGRVSWIHHHSVRRSCFKRERQREWPKYFRETDIADQCNRSGQKFAATHSEAMFLPGLIPEKTRKIVDDTK